MATQEILVHDIPQKEPHLWNANTALFGSPKDSFQKFNLEHSRLLTDDYVHKKFLTTKFTAKTPNFIVNAKGGLDMRRNIDGTDAPATSLEAKFITRIAGNEYEARFDNKDQIRLWANFGRVRLWPIMLVTAKLKSTNRFDKLSGNVCAEYQGPRFNVITRLDLKPGFIPYMNEKITYTYLQYQAGYILKYNIKGFNLERYNFLVAYRERSYALFAEHISVNKQQIELGKLLFGTLLRHNDTEYVLKASYRPYKVRDEAMRLKAGFVTPISKDCTFRAKINNKTKLTLSGKYRMNPNLTIAAATQFTLFKPETMFTQKIVPLPIGVSLEFSCN